MLQSCVNVLISFFGWLGMFLFTFYTLHWQHILFFSCIFRSFATVNAFIHGLDKILKRGGRKTHDNVKRNGIKIQMMTLALDNKNFVSLSGLILQF